MPHTRIRLLPLARLAVTLCLAARMLVSAPAVASADDRVDTASVDRWVADYLQAEGLPGAAVWRWCTTARS